MYARQGPESYEDLLADAVYVEQVIAESKKTSNLAEKRRLEEEAAEVDFVAMTKSGPLMNSTAKVDPVVAAIERQGDRYEKVLNSQAEMFKKQENIRQKQVDMMYSELRQLKNAQDEALSRSTSQVNEDNRPTKAKLHCSYCNKDNHSILKCWKLRKDQDRVNLAYQRELQSKESNARSGNGGASNEVKWVPKKQQPKPQQSQDVRLHE